MEEKEIRKLYDDILKSKITQPFIAADLHSAFPNLPYEWDVLLVELRRGNPGNSLAIFDRQRSGQYSLLPQPEMPSTKNWGPLRSGQWILGALAVIGMAWSIWLSTLHFGEGFDKNDCVKVAQARVLCFWIIAPPIWFWIEYFFLYNLKRPQPKLDHEKFKYGQDQSAKIWLALVTVLLGLYFGKDFAHESAAPAPPVANAQCKSSSIEQWYPCPCLLPRWMTPTCVCRTVAKK